MTAPKSRNPQRQRFERLEARITPEQKKLFKRAADLEGRSLTDFVISTVAQAAQKVVQDHEILTLTARDQKLFVKMLVNPPPPKKALIDAFRRHDERILE